MSPRFTFLDSSLFCVRVRSFYVKKIYNRIEGPFTAAGEWL